MGLPAEVNELFFGLQLTEEQQEMVNSIFNNQITIVNAKAGTGKTQIAVACAKLLNKPMRYIFAPVEEDKLGFTPGELEDKESKYIVPLLDALKKIKEDPRFAVHRDKNPDDIKKSAWIKAQSHVFARGTNFEKETIIIDEAQNFTVGELRKVLTRVHDNCTVIMIGHVGQIDLPDPAMSGFLDYIKHFETEEYAKVIHLTKNFRGRLANHADKI